MYPLLDVKAGKHFTGTAYPRISAGIPHFVNASSKIHYQFAKQALWVLSSVVGTDNWKWQVRQSTTDYQPSWRCWSCWQSQEVCSNSAGLCQIVILKRHRVQAPSREGGGHSFWQLCRPKCALVIVSKSSHKSFSLSAGLWEPCRIRGQAAVCKLLCWRRHTAVLRWMRAVQICLKHQKLGRQNNLYWGLIYNTRKILLNCLTVFHLSSCSHKLIWSWNKEVCAPPKALIKVLHVPLHQGQPRVVFFTPYFSI